jgi:hypothetical protein
VLRARARNRRLEKSLAGNDHAASDALAGGATVTPDPKRAGFYEVKRREQLFYIYISPDTGKVLLIAAWPHEEALVCEAGASA